MQANLSTCSFSSPFQDSELTELKDTIDILKTKNTEAQEIIQGALSNPDIMPNGTEKAANTIGISKASFPKFNIPILSFGS